MLSWHWVDILHWLMRIIYSGHECVALCAVCSYSQRLYWLILGPRKDQTQQLSHVVARRVLLPTSMLPDENSVRSALKMSSNSKNVKPGIKSLNQTARSDFFFAIPLSLREENGYKDLERCLLTLLVIICLSTGWTSQLFYVTDKMGNRTESWSLLSSGAVVLNPFVVDIYVMIFMLSDIYVMIHSSRKIIVMKTP